jgi:hypothetical protein
VPAKDRRNAWTLGGIAIDQVSASKYPGVVYQEDGSWQAYRQKALAKMKQPMGTEATKLTCSSLPTKVRLFMVQTFIYSAVMYGAEVDTTKAVKDKMSAVVKKALRSILSPASPRLLFDVPGDTGLLHPVYSLMPLQTVLAATTEHGGWPMAQGGNDSHSRVAGVGRPKVGTDWCGNVNPLLSRSSTLNTVTAQAKGQPALRRVAPRRSPASLDAVRSQPEVDTQDEWTMSRRWRVVSEAVLTNLGSLR